MQPVYVYYKGLFIRFLIYNHVYNTCIVIFKPKTPSISSYCLLKSEVAYIKEGKAGSM